MFQKNREGLALSFVLSLHAPRFSVGVLNTAFRLSCASGTAQVLSVARMTDEIVFIYSRKAANDKGMPFSVL